MSNFELIQLWKIFKGLIQNEIVAAVSSNWNRNNKCTSLNFRFVCI